jgi:hypothetical protein
MGTELPPCDFAPSHWRGIFCQRRGVRKPLLQSFAIRRAQMFAAAGSVYRIMDCAPRRRRPPALDAAALMMGS